MGYRKPLSIKYFIYLFKKKKNLENFNDRNKYKGGSHIATTYDVLQKS